MKNRPGGGGCISSFLQSFTRHVPRDSTPFPLYSCALSCRFLHQLKTQPFYFQAIPHSFAKTPGGGVPLCSMLCSIGIRPGLSGASNFSFSVDSLSFPLSTSR